MPTRPVYLTDSHIQEILAGSRKYLRALAMFPMTDHNRSYTVDDVMKGDSAGIESLCPFGQKGDVLWVREAWQAIHVYVDPETGYGDDLDYAKHIPDSSQSGWWQVVYRADEPNTHVDDRGFPWRPSATMPKWACRLELTITKVRLDGPVWDVSFRTKMLQSEQASQLGGKLFKV